MSNLSKTPIAKLVPHSDTTHGITRVDNYHWLRDRENPEVLDYLKAENAYTDAVMADTKDLQDTLYEEMRGRIKEDDITVPVKKGDYFYYSRTAAGDEYEVHCRKHGSLEAAEEVLLDENELAKGHKHCSVGEFLVSPDHTLIAYAIDFTGNECYTLYFKNLETGELLSDQIENTCADIEWLNDSERIIYTLRDPSDMRPVAVYLHKLGDPNDTCLYEENDTEYYMRLRKTRDNKYIFIKSASKVTSETHVINASDTGVVRPQVILPREHGHEYYVSHHYGYWYIVTNYNGATNFKLIKTPIDTPKPQHWEELIAADAEVVIRGIHVFNQYLIVYEHQEAVTSARVIKFADQTEYYIEIPEPIYELRAPDNVEFDTEVFRFAYSSFITPQSTFEFNLRTKERTLLKQNEVVGGHDPSQYETRRIYATAPDGESIPISIVHKKGLTLDGTNPCWLTAYGSYGSSYPVGFTSNRLSMLDRGFVYALAHVRGGGDKGRRWYHDGKFLNKKNTFTDFIAAAEQVIKAGYTSPSKLVAIGGSAGGMLMGAVVNMRPDLFQGIIAAVPFVDVVNTMLDPTIPLTTLEYEEWGNPTDPKYFEYMLSYSPYDNVIAQSYPHLLVTAGLNDPRVQYWEPAKWVAKLRDLKTDKNLLLLKTELEHGHSGATGRFDYLKEIALEYAFALKVTDTVNN